jgi:hypothetical protein
VKTEIKGNDSLINFKKKRQSHYPECEIHKNTVRTVNERKKKLELLAGNSSVLVIQKRLEQEAGGCIWKRERR